MTVLTYPINLNEVEYKVASKEPLPVIEPVLPETKNMCGCDLIHGNFLFVAMVTVAKELPPPIHLRENHPKQMEQQSIKRNVDYH